MSRILEQRIGIVTNTTYPIIPLAYVQSQFGYSVQSIQRNLHCESMLYINDSIFPATIVSYSWIHSDMKKGVWKALGRLENGTWFYYTANLNGRNSFLEKGCTMNLWVTMQYKNLIQFAMTQTEYTTYLAETILRESANLTDATSQTSHQASAASK